MEIFQGYSKEELEALQAELDAKIKKYQGMGLNLNMARGKPCKKQLDLSDGLIDGTIDLSINGDYRNYGIVDGIPEAKELFKGILNVETDEIIIGGNSSLNMMYDALTKAMLLGTVDSDKPWCREESVKFLCPVPGYDRHFTVCEALGIEMINVPMDENGPDMDIVEKLAAEDKSVKGIWCVPKYSNPSGITYSDEVVDRLASMKTAAGDFRIMWDNAYVVHHLSGKGDELKDILAACKAAGNDNRVYMFASTSKMTYPGAGVGMMGSSKANTDFIRKQMGAQTIGPNKVNQYMHVKFFKNMAGIEKHMEKQGEILAPKFETVLWILEDKLGGKGLASWNKPNGGYFISLDVPEGCAKEVVSLCKGCGVTLTPAGATFPYGKDPLDNNIRIAPTFPPMSELEMAIDILCACVEAVSVRKALNA